jgi:ABC-type transport system involved in multi-copper enzyme maturation permease subunit
MNMRQMMAIASVEVRVGFRRRALGLIALLMLTGIVLFSLISRETLNAGRIGVPDGVGEVVVYGDLIPPGGDPEIEAILPEWLRPVSIQGLQRTASAFTALLAGTVVLTVGIILFMSESIPIDRQHRVQPLIDAAPVSRATWLAGKLVGVWLGTGAAAALACVIGGAVAWAILGEFDLRLYVLVSTTFTLPLLLISGALAVLVASPVGSRRLAVLVGLLTVPIALIALSWALPSLGGLGVHLERAYGLLLLIDLNADGIALTNARLRDALPLLVGIPLAAWTVAWVWARWREAR